jgi:hypothetical protein
MVKQNSKSQQNSRVLQKKANSQRCKKYPGLVGRDRQKVQEFVTPADAHFHENQLMCIFMKTGQSNLNFSKI